MDAEHRMPAPSVASAAVTALLGGQGSDEAPRWHETTAGGGPAGGAGSLASRSDASRSLVPLDQGSAALDVVSNDVRGGAADPWPTDSSPGSQPASTSASKPADAWPEWARPQLLAAAQVAGRLAGGSTGSGLAAELHRSWFLPRLDSAAPLTSARGPLGGVYRHAHAGSGAPINVNGIAIVDRQDVIGRDGWWRTWGDDWTPRTGRAGSVRVLLSPRPDAVAEFVSDLTAELLGRSMPWMLACTTDPRRLRRAGAAVLYVPDAESLDEDLLSRVRPTLRAVTSPLCLPVAPGVAVCEDPGLGMSFGMHRSHVVALGLGRPGALDDPLAAIAAAFEAHGLDLARPHRSALPHPSALPYRSAA
jgi:HopA1 effector protein family